MVLGGRYRIEGPAGEKKSCIAFRAVRVTDGLPVALKVLAPFVRKQPHVVSRLRSRAGFAMGMDHPNLVPVHDVREEGEAFMIVEGWFEALPLLRVVRGKGACSPYEVAWLASQLARGVDHLISSHAPGFDFTLSDVYVDVSDPRLGVRLSVLALEGDGFSERALATPTDSAQPLVRSVARIIFNLVTGGMGDPLIEPVLSEKFTTSLRECLTGAIQPANCRDLLWTLFEDFGPGVTGLLPSAAVSQEAPAGEMGSILSEELEVLRDQLCRILYEDNHQQMPARLSKAAERPALTEQGRVDSPPPAPVIGLPVAPLLTVSSSEPTSERPPRKIGVVVALVAMVILIAAIPVGWYIYQPLSPKNLDEGIPGQVEQAKDPQIMDPQIKDPPQQDPQMQEAISKRESGQHAQAISLYVDACGGSLAEAAEKELASYLKHLAADFPSSLKSDIANNSADPYAEVLRSIEKALGADAAASEARLLESAIHARIQAVTDALAESGRHAEASEWKESLQALNQVYPTHPEFPQIAAEIRLLAGRIAKVANTIDPSAQIDPVIAELEIAETGGIEGLGQAITGLQAHLCEQALAAPGIMQGLDMLMALETKHPGHSGTLDAANKIGEKLANDYDKFFRFNPFRDVDFFIREQAIDLTVFENAAKILVSPALKRELARLKPQETEQWLSEAANGGDSRAKIRYAAILQPWSGPSKDPAKARGLLEEAWKSKDMDAGVPLSRMYIDGFGGAPEDCEKALGMLDQVLAATPDHGDALFLKGRALEKQGKVKEAFEQYVKASDQRPGLVRLFKFDGVSKPRYFDPFLRIGAAFLDGELGEAASLEQAREWFLKGGMCGTTYSGVTACDLSWQHKMVTTEADKQKWRTLSSVLLLLGDRKAGDFLTNAELEPIKGPDLDNDLQKRCVDDIMEQAGWCYLRALVALKTGAEMETGDDRQAVDRLKEIAKESMLKAASLHHPLAKRWCVANGFGG